VIGHLKDDYRIGRNHLKGRDGDDIDAVLAAAGYNLSLLRRCFEQLLRALRLIIRHIFLAHRLRLIRRSENALHGRRYTDAKALAIENVAYDGFQFVRKTG
jgi:hypothetical protein